jgi:hypothetical protein
MTNIETPSFSVEDYEHIAGSSMPPERLAEIYGVTHQTVNKIQMGKMTYFEVLNSLKKPAT